MSLKTIILIGLVLVSKFALANTFTLPRTDGTQITFYFDAPNSKSFPILIGFQGSTCESAQRMHQMMSSLVQQNIAVLSVEKRGLTSASTDCPQEYIENNTIQDRVFDYLQIIAFLRTREQRWNHRLGLAGGSEGGVVASLLAPLVPEASTLTILATGGGLTMGEELLLLTEKQMKNQGTSPEQIQATLNEMKSKFAEIFANPTPNQEWLSDGKTARNTYKWWSSILKLRLEHSLLTLTIPIYLVHGTADTSTPIESADLLAKAFNTSGKTNLLYQRYEGLEHNWTDKDGNHHPEVLNDAMMWIIKNL